MNTATNLSVPSFPEINRASARIMRRVDLSIPETSLDWTPSLRPVYSFVPRSDMPESFDAADTSLPVRAANYFAVCRPGYEEDPFGIVTDDYRPLCHETTAGTVRDCGANLLREGALIDGHGYHTVHTFRLSHVRSATIKGLPLTDRLMLVHDHTGKGSVRASIVTYLGRAVVGSSAYVRKIHVGEGAKRVGAGGIGGWTNTIAALCETAILQQDALVDMLSRVSELPVTDDRAKIFRSWGIEVAEDIEKRPSTCLHIMIEHHEAQRGDLRWGVWSRRLEGDAIRAGLEITGMSLDGLPRR